MKTVKVGKVQHTLHCLERTWFDLTEIKDQNDLADYGSTLDFLVDFFLNFKDALDDAKEREAQAAQAIENAKDEVAKTQARHNHLDRRQIDLEAWEKQAANRERMPYLPLVAAKELLAMGLGVQDIESLGRVVQASGLSPANLAEALEEIGGVATLGMQLQEHIETLETQRASLITKLADLNQQYNAAETQAHDDLAATTGRLKIIEAEMADKQKAVADTDQVVAQVRQFAGNVEQVYRVAGIVFNGPIREVFQKAGVARIEHLPVQSLLALAGSVLVVAEVMNGQDHTFDIHRSLENVVPVKLRLSEIPLLFAKPEYYQGQRELVLRQMEAMAGMEEENV